MNTLRAIDRWFSPLLTWMGNHEETNPGLVLFVQWSLVITAFALFGQACETAGNILRFILSALL